jgi:hypothetical protein
MQAIVNGLNAEGQEDAEQRLSVLGFKKQNF